MNLTQKELKEFVHYNPDTGIFTWLPRSLKYFKTKKSYASWNSRCANKEAGAMCQGYIVFAIKGRRYQAHRLAFLYMEGYIPENEIDHKDRIRHHNWWDNLREVSVICNRQNSSVSKRNKSGVTGVGWSKARNTYYAKITVNFKLIDLGCFKTLTEAVIARYKEEQRNPMFSCSIETSASIFLRENNILVP